ncbi:MAG TPA: class I SAM-dependent methyltransferase [Candidatus Nanoarchaeia archaeon]|nr:class I SAM-dependent methyltransferase [Candidatus Nanoarchaeia archaeon]
MPKDWSDEFVHHWNYFIGPARASPSDLRFIKKKILEKDRDAKVLVLGATPGYRNLCGELDIPVTLIDFKRYNYEYLSDEVKNKPKERFVEGNWMDTVLPEKFDIILADNVLNVVPTKENIRIVLKNVASMLKKDGLFMPRTYVRGKNERIDPEKVIKEYRKKRDGSDLYTWLSRDLYLAAYDFKEDVVRFKDIWKVIKKMHDNGLFTDEELKEWRNNSFENREFHFIIPVKEEIEEILSEFFNIKQVFCGTEEYIHETLPLYVLTLK